MKMIELIMNDDLYLFTAQFISHGDVSKVVHIPAVVVVMFFNDLVGEHSKSRIVCNCYIISIG